MNFRQLHSPLTRWQHCAIWFSGFLLLSAIQLIYLDYGLNIWDEGVLINGVLRTLDGETPGKDFIGYPPFRYWWGNLFMQIFGETVHAIRLSVVPLTSLTTLLIIAISMRIMPLPFALAAGAMNVAAPGVYYTRYFTFTAILCLFFLLRYLQSGRIRFRLEAFSVSFLTALFIKLETGMIFLLLSLVILFRDYGRKERGTENRPLLFTLLITALITVATFLILTRQQELLSLWELFTPFLNIPLALSLWGTSYPNLHDLLSGEWNFTEWHLFFLPFILTLLTLLHFLKGDKQKTETQVVLCINLAALLLFSLVIVRTGFDNLLRVLPPFLILLCYELSLLYRFLQKKTEAFHPSQPIRSLPLLLTLAYPLLYCSTMATAEGFYAGSPGARLQCGYSRECITYETPIGTLKVKAPLAALLYEITTTVKKEADENSTLFTLPINPLFNALTQLKNPTSFDYFLPIQSIRKEDERKLLQQLTNTKPDIIILSTIAIDNDEKRRVEQYAPSVFRYIVQNYLAVNMVENFFVMVKEEKKRE